MIVSRFLLWARAAAPGDRAEAVSALARAYLYSDMTPEDRWQAQTALTAMLDDGSSLVRRALAETLASSPYSPRHIIVALASDQNDVAAIVLARSPVLADCDLVDCAALGDEPVQCAIASRPSVSPAVCGALAEIGAPRALVVLSANSGAEITNSGYARMVERHGSHGPLREALLARPELPVDVAQAIAAALAQSLGRFVTGCGWLSSERSDRVVREARERATVALSARTEAADESERLVAHLRRSGQLSPALMLRAILSEAMPFAVAAFAELSGVPAKRVSAILTDRHGGSFRALFKKTGLPEMLRPAFEAALNGLRGTGAPKGAGGSLSRRMIARAIEACRALPQDESSRLTAMLHRFEMEAARDEAKHAADGLADQAALALVQARAPHLLLDTTSRLAA